MKKWPIAGAATAVALAAAGTAAAAIFGTEPVPVSVTADGAPANGPSGGAAVSGDDRKGRYVAFHSEASNLLPGDTNAHADVFLWERPEGRRGTRGLDEGPARPAGELQRVSVNTDDQQANGPSLRPQVGGSVQNERPRCVVFQSRATNLSRFDDEPDWDVYVRDLRYDSTRLMSRFVDDAGDAAIDGNCRRVLFEAGGEVYYANARARGRKPRALSRGDNPDISLNGDAIAYERGRRVYLRRYGETTRVAGRGRNPVVSDRGEQARWGVVFDTRSSITRGDRDRDYDVYLRIFDRDEQRGRTKLISASDSGRSLPGDSFNGGATAFVWDRGIVVFVNHGEDESTLYYHNRNTGNIDDLAHAKSGSERDPAIEDVASSARANFVVFSSTDGGFSFDRNGGVQDVFVKHLVDGEELD